MASIIKLGGKWRAQIRRKGHKDITKQFDTKAAAAAWAADIEGQIKSGVPAVSDDTIAALVKQYRAMRAKSRPILDTTTEHYTLKMLTATLGHKVAKELTVEDLQGWALERRDSGAGAYTVNCDLSKLGTVARYVFPTLLTILAAARPKLSYLGLIGGGGLRERRPTAEEMIVILQWLCEHKGRQYSDFAEFAALTAMRRSEISNLRWSDLDEAGKMILVRNRKDPRQKQGNDQLVPLLAGSFDVLQRQTRSSELCFPLHPQTISKYFKQACDALGIPDLHLHDMRHEGISQMFEHGYEIPQVAVVSGHKSWSHLKRYTNIKPETLHALDTRRDTAPRPDSLQTALPRPGKS